MRPHFPRVARRERTISNHIQWLDATLSRLSSLVLHAARSLSGDLQTDQVELYELAFCEAELETARAFLEQEFARESDGQGKGSEDSLQGQLAITFAAQTCLAAQSRLGHRNHRYGLELDRTIEARLTPLIDSALLSTMSSQLLNEGLPEPRLDDEQNMIRRTFAAFADDVVAPLAEDIHRQDLIIPDAILKPLRAMGCFGLSVPERYGGLKPDDREDSMGMVLVTEELSRGSLGAAGSLITRPEIMARAILEGGTEAQKQRWLPSIATGDPLCAISVTEPNTGSDVAAVRLKARKTESGWLLNGAKTWCTFAGKAGLILVLARTEDDVRPPHRGLSLFVVNKPSHDGHEFEIVQETGGRLAGRAIPTIGYRGMHSFEMFYEDFFVPDSDLIGEEEGRGKGFYFTMRGFMGGRLQTAARAGGLMRAAFEEAARFTQDRQVFGAAVAALPLSAVKLTTMASRILACRAFTHKVAQLMDAGSGVIEASLVKLISCRYAEEVTREALQLHGGMGYAEEAPVSRYFLDARVLSIFEGAEETLAIRVVGKALVERAQSNGPARS